MRIWTLHPKYLDAKGLVALWRETLLAKNVLQGNTKGYKNHPQLIRFKQSEQPIEAIDQYLEFVFQESVRRDYRFDEKKFDKSDSQRRIVITQGQIEYEFDHLKNKLSIRDISKFEELRQIVSIESHPLFTIVPGNIEDWEIRK